MADIIKDSFNPSNQFDKVVAQRGRDLCDYEFNEAQDDARFMSYSSLLQQQGLSNPATSRINDWRVIATGASNSVTVKAGSLLVDGINIINAADSTLSSFSTHGSAGVDTVYVQVTEIEVADPAITTQIGETTRRCQLQFTLAVSNTGPSGVPTNSVAPIMSGGIHYFILANIVRHAGQAAINAIDVSDVRGILPSGWSIYLCGDGASSLGTFNGPDSISRALAQAIALGYSSVTIVVGEGSYAITDTSLLTVPSSFELIVVGSGYLGTTILLEAATASSGMTVGTGSSVIFKDVSFAYTGSGSRVFADFSGGRISFYRCVAPNGVAFTATSPTSAESTVLYAKSCSFGASLSAAGTPNFSIVVGQSSLANGVYQSTPGVIFEDCVLGTSQNTPFVFLKPAVGMTGLGVFDGIKFIRCNCTWASATTTSGNLTGNPSGVDVDPTGYHDPSTAALIVRLIEYIDCNVLATGVTSGTGSQVLLRMVPFKNAVSSSSGAYVLVKVRITGGVWQTQDAPVDFNSFTLIALQVEIEGLTVRENGNAGGNVTADLANYFSFSTALVASTWAQVFICTQVLTTLPSAFFTQRASVRNMMLLNPPRAGTTGDLWIVFARGHIDGVSLDGWVTGAGSLPTFRCKFSGGDASTSIVEGVTLDMPPMGTGNFYISHASPSLSGYIVVNPATTLRKSQVLGPTVGTGPDTLASGITCAVFTPGSGVLSDIVIDSNEVENCFHGLRMDDISVFGELVDVRVTDNKFIANGGDGINFGPTNSLTVGRYQQVLISGNTCYNNKGYGIHMYQSASAGLDSLAIVGNICVNNVGDGNLSFPIQIYLVDEAPGSGPFGSVFANDCWGANNAIGCIRVQQGGGVLTSPTIKGLETARLVSGGQTGSSVWADTSEMLHNRGNLRNF